MNLSFHFLRIAHQLHPEASGGTSGKSCIFFNEQVVYQQEYRSLPDEYEIVIE